MTDASYALGFHSHLPILAAACADSQSCVYEFGVGYGSTPLLHYLQKLPPFEGGAMYMNKLVSADGDAAWIERFSSYKSKDHRFVCIYGGVEGWLEFIEREPKSLLDHSTVLVDCAPGEARVPIIKALKKYEPRFIIAHDTDRPESASAYGWHELDGLYKYETTMKRLLPWTTVYSDVEKFQLEECDS